MSEPNMLRFELSRGPAWFRRLALVVLCVLAIPVGWVGQVLIEGTIEYVAELRDVIWPELVAAWRRIGGA